MQAGQDSSPAAWVVLVGFVAVFVGMLAGDLIRAAGALLYRRQRRLLAGVTDLVLSLHNLVEEQRFFIKQALDVQREFRMPERKPRVALPGEKEVQAAVVRLVKEDK